MKKFKWLVMVLLAFVLVATACGGQDAAPSETEEPEETNGDASSGEGATEESSGGTVKVGALLPYSGVYTTLGENLTRGMELYFESVGWQAGGKEIELITEDSESDPQVSLRKFRKLVDQDEIDILTGPVSTAVAYALRDEVEANQLPFLVSHAGGNDLTRSQRSDYIWRSSFTSWQAGSSMGQWAFDNVTDEAYLIAPDYAFGHEVVEGFKEAFTEAGGTVVGEAFPPLGHNDYASYLTEISNAGPKAVYAFFAGSDASRFVQQYQQYGLEGEIPLIGSGWLNAEDVRPAQEGAGEGMITTMFWDYNLDNPENEEFVQAYEEAYGERPSIESVEGYDAARIIVETLEAVNGDVSDADAFFEAMAGLEFDSPRGAIRFDPETHQIIQPFYVIETVIKDGQTENEVIDTIGEVQDPGE